jgi:hypothetical protein
LLLQASASKPYPSLCSGCHHWGTYGCKAIKALQQALSSSSWQGRSRTSSLRLRVQRGCYAWQLMEKRVWIVKSMFFPTTPLLDKGWTALIRWLHCIRLHDCKYIKLCVPCCPISWVTNPCPNMVICMDLVIISCLLLCRNKLVYITIVSEV